MSINLVVWQHCVLVNKLAATSYHFGSIWVNDLVKVLKRVPQNSESNWLAMWANQKYDGYKKDIIIWYTIYTKTVTIDYLLSISMPDNWLKLCSCDLSRDRNLELNLIAKRVSDVMTQTRLRQTNCNGGWFWRFL